jgi:Ca2+-binding RTX toxin-like protein
MAQYNESTSQVVERLQDSDLGSDTSSAIESLLNAVGSEGETTIQDYDGTPPDPGTTVLNVGPGHPLTNDPGTPVVIMHPDAPGAQVTLAAGTGSDRIFVAGGGNDNISVGSSTQNKILKQDSQETTSDGNITIETGGGNDTINTGDGNDMVTITGSGDNTVSTGEGDDTINMIGSGNDTVDTGSGDDTVIITGSGGQGSVSTGDGNDTITVTGSGTYTIDTGDGEDTLVVETDKGEFTIVDPDGPDLLTPSGDDLLSSIIETELGSEGGEVNPLIFNTLSARLDQMIDNGTYSKLSASIAMSAFSTVINDATEIGDLTDAVEDANDALFAEAADQYTIEEHGFAFEEVPLVGIDGTQYVIEVFTS